MNYLQLEIGGKKRGLKFSQGTLILFQDSIKNYSESEIKAFASHQLVFAALKTNCIIKGDEVDFTFENVFDWVEQLHEEELQKVLVAFNESQKFKVDIPVEKKAEDEKKKKVTAIKQTATELQES